LAFTIEKLREDLSFGALVTGLTPADIASEEVRERLRETWLIDGLIVFRGAKVTPDFMVDLSEVFAPTSPHVVQEIRHPENEKLIRLISKPTDEEQNLIEVDGKLGCGFSPWHKDIVFTSRMNHGGLLTCTKITSSGGETGYALLDEETRARIEGLEVIYKMVALEDSPWATRQKARWIRHSTELKSVLSREWPRVAHPLVFVQPKTGRKVLNLSPHYALGIVGMENDEGNALLTRLVNHIWDSPQYHHAWQPDEMVLWDNWRMLHSVGVAPYQEERIVERTTLNGDYGLGRILDPAAAAA
jgi:taurine dioxygenase